MRYIEKQAYYKNSERRTQVLKTNSKTEKQQSIIASIVYLIIITFLLYLSYLFRGEMSKMLGIYGLVMLTYLTCKMGLAFFYKPYTNQPPLKKVSVIIPSYNEKVEATINTVKSILNQNYPIHEVFFIDDGSKDISSYNAMMDFKSKYDLEKSVDSPTLIVHRLEKNQGKRHAQIWAFERATGDIYFTVDSDSYIYPDALLELMRPFMNEEVMAVTGHINVKNRKYNYFTRLLDMRYDNAFRIERAAQSITGNILVCSGPISCYRREVIMDNIEKYRNQIFLSKPVQLGDDRCLTNFAIARGKTVYQSKAKCETDVPQNIISFIKQQNRWNKSFFRESIEALKVGTKKPLVAIWALSEVLLWILFTFVVVNIGINAWDLGFQLVIFYIITVSLCALARNVYYVYKHPFFYFSAPIYGFIHLIFLYPLKFYSLFTLKKNDWGTR